MAGLSPIIWMTTQLCGLGRKKGKGERRKAKGEGGKKKVIVLEFTLLYKVRTSWNSLPGISVQNFLVLHKTWGLETV